MSARTGGTRLLLSHAICCQGRARCYSEVVSHVGALTHVPVGCAVLSATGITRHESVAFPLAKSVRALGSQCVATYYTYNHNNHMYRHREQCGCLVATHKCRATYLCNYLNNAVRRVCVHYQCARGTPEAAVARATTNTHTHSLPDVERTMHIARTRTHRRGRHLVLGIYNWISAPPAVNCLHLCVLTL